MEETKQVVILYDDEFITARYDPQHKFIYHTIHKPVEGQPLRDALIAGTEALEKYKVTKWLSDDRLNAGLSEEDREWGMKNWNVRTIEAGWKYWAMVVPPGVVAAGSMIPTMNAWYELGLRMMVFSTLEEAIDWLDGV